MSKKPEVIEDDHDFEEISELEHAEVDEIEEEVARITDLLANSDKELEVRIYRVPPKGKKLGSYLFTIDPSEINEIEERLTHTYGSGIYEVRLWDGRTIRGRMKIEVEAPPGDKLELKTSNGDNSSLMVQSMREMMLTQQIEMQKSMLELVTKLTSNQPQTTMTDLIGSLISLKKLSGDDEKKESPTQILREMMELQTQVREFASDQPPQDGFAAVIKSLGTLTELAKNRNNESSQKNNAPETGDNMINWYIQSEIKKLCMHAENGRDTQFYAEYVLDQIPDKYVDILMNNMQTTNDEAFLKLVEFSPQVIKYREWFIELLGHIRALLTNEADDSITSADDERISIANDLLRPIRESGRAGDSENNGEVNKRR